MPGVLAVLTGVRTGPLERHTPVTARRRGRLAGEGHERRGLAHRLPAADLCGRRGSLRGRDRRHGGRRGPPPGSRRRRGHRGRLRGEAGQHGHRQGARPRHPAGASRLRHERSAGHRARAEGGDRGRAGCGPSRDRGRGAHQPRHRCLDGAPCLPGPLRPGERPLHGVDHQPGAAHRPPLLHQVAAHSRAQAQGDRAGCRRRLRDEALPLSRRGAGAVGRDRLRPARALGGHALRVPAGRHAREGPPHGGPHGLRRERQNPRREVRDPCRLRRLREPVAGEHHQRLSLHHALARLRHPGDSHPGARRLHQRDAGGRLPRRWAAGGGLSGRAHDRERRPGDGHRPAGAARAQPDPAREVPVPDRPRHHLRFRRPAGAHGEDHGARRLRCAPRRAGQAQGGRPVDGHRHLGFL